MTAQAHRECLRHTVNAAAAAGLTACEITWPVGAAMTAMVCSMGGVRSWTCCCCQWLLRLLVLLVALSVFAPAAGPKRGVQPPLMLLLLLLLLLGRCCSQYTKTTAGILEGGGRGEYMIDAVDLIVCVDEGYFAEPGLADLPWSGKLTRVNWAGG